MTQLDLFGQPLPKTIEERKEISKKQQEWFDAHKCTSCGIITKDLNQDYFLCESCISYKKSKF